MPFEIAQPKVGRFQEYADAMLRGCAVTKPSERLGNCFVYDDNGNVTHACAYYALRVGLGHFKRDFAEFDPMDVMWDAYTTKYGIDIVSDYEKIGRSREEIAARIAAL